MVHIMKSYFERNKLCLLSVVLFSFMQLINPLITDAMGFQQVSKGLVTTSVNSSKEKRVALVIGNSEYDNSPLKNPVNDAREINKVLKEAGFEILMGLNTNKIELESLIRQFGEKIRDGAVGLFYYSGHGVLIKGKNYLLPIGFKVNDEADIKYESIDMQLLFEEMEESNNKLNIVIIDACRNNPFKAKFRSISDGFGAVNAPSGSIICYSTSPGGSASDGAGNNGLYTKSLLKFMQVPGLEISDLFRQVRAEVKKESNGEQIPWEVSSLDSSFSFFPNKEIKSATEPSAPAAVKQSDVKVTGPSEAIEIEFWNSIKASKDINDFKVYLTKFPTGSFVELANNRISTLTEPKVAITNPTREVEVLNVGDFVRIPAGEMEMTASNPADPKVKSNKIVIKDGFDIGKFEVTQEIWQKIMGNNPSRFQGDNLPVESVSWNDVQEFLKVLNSKSSKYQYRLPTEAEWEYAFHAGNIKPANDETDANCWFQENSVGSTHSVGLKAANAWGLFDMNGNVWEWCSDWYEVGMNKNLSRNKGLSKIIVGGSWISSKEEVLANRDYDLPEARRCWIGFRLLRANK